MIDIKEMLKAGVHFGHKTSRWHPKMRPFIWGSRNHVHLIDVSKTAFLLERAGKVLKELAENNGTFLFIGTKKPAQESIKRVATNLKQPYLVNRWIGGTLSNYDQVKKAIVRYLHLQDVIKKPTVHFKKKELSMVQKEIDRLDKNIGGIVDLTYPPAALIVVDAQRECSAVKEATSLGIPVVALVDTNTNPDDINFVIPSNDDSPRAINFVLSYLEAQIAEGLAIAQQRKQEEREAASVTKDGSVAASEASAKPHEPRRSENNNRRPQSRNNNNSNTRSGQPRRDHQREARPKQSPEQPQAQDSQEKKA